MAGWADLAMAADAASGGSLPPDVVTGIAQGSQTPGDAAQTAQASAQMVKTQDQVNGLKQQSNDQQAKLWKTLSKQEQQAYQSAGYKPPAEHETGVLGFLGRMVHDVNNDVFKPVERDVLAPVLGNQPVHDVLNAMGSPLRGTQHLIRATHMLSETAASNPQNANKGLFSSFSDLFDPKPYEAMFSPHDWAQAWNKTEHGEQTFDPYTDRQLQQQYGADVAGLAKEVASGKKVQDILAKYQDQGAPLDADGNTPRQAVAKRLMSDPHTKEAITQYQNAHLSFGREVVGSKFMTDHPAAGKPLSGAIDATIDWFDDPMGPALKTAKALSDARYLVLRPEDLDRLYNGSSAYQAVTKSLADSLRAKDASQAIKRFPKLEPLAQQMIKEGVDSPEAVNEFFKGQITKLATLRGMAAKVGGTPGFIAPHLGVGTRLGEAASVPIRGLVDQAQGIPIIGKTADFLAHPINFLADTPSRMQDIQPGEAVTKAQIPGSAAHPILNAALHPFATLETGLGRTARSFLTLDPTVGGKAFVADSDQALSTIRNYAQAFLPKARVDELVNTYAQADTLGLKYKIWRGVVDEVGHAAGVDLTPESAAWWQQTMGKMDEHVPGKQYSFPGNDQWLEGDQPLTAGLLKGHMQEAWAMPQFRELYAQTRKISMTRSVMGAVNNAAVDHLMQSVWKPLTLMHLGFTIRTATDELLGAVLREGPLGIAKARLAGSSLDTGAPLLPYHPLGRIWDAFTAHLPQQAVDRISTPADLVAEYFGDKVNRGMRNVAGKLAGEEYVSAARAAYEGGYLDGTVPEIVSAMHGRAAGYMDDAPTVQKLMMDGQVKKVQLKPDGNWRGYQPGEQMYHHMWASNLDEIAKDDWARTSLEHLGDTQESRAGAVADQLQTDPQWRKSVRSTGTSDGRRIAMSEVTEREAALDHANRINQHVDSLITGADGNTLQAGDRTLAQHLLDEHRTPSVAALAEHPEESLPAGVRGPDVIPIPSNKFQSLVSKGFDNLVGRPMNWMVRQPMWLHNFAESRQAVGGLADQLAEKYGGNANLDKIMTDIAAERATNKTLPYIHDPGVRSQFAVVTRNLMPFWFAQEQAFKRWARTFTYAPQAMRQMQLLNGGMQHSGIVHTDQQSGQQYFLFPGTTFADKSLNALAERVTGNKFTLPIPTDMQGSVKWLSPIRDGVLPSFSPVVAMPLTALVNHFPELQPLKQAALQHAGNAQYLKEVMPSTVWQVLDAAAPNLVNHAQYNSAWNQTIQSWEATGHGLGPDATPEQIQTLLDRTKNFTRTRIILRTLLGFGTPATPQISLDHLDNQLQQLMTQLPPSEAISVFQQMNPDATPYTVFQSKSISGAPLPATKTAMDWMNNNQGLIKKYPYAAAYLLPQDPGKYDATAYQEQLATGLRIRKTPEQFLDDILYQQAAGDYFHYEQQKSQLIAQTHNSYTKTQINNTWSQWSRQYMDQHPVFSKIMSGGADGLPPATWTRTQVQAEMAHAVNNEPAIRDDPKYDSLRTMVNSYDQYQAQVAPYSGNQNTYLTHIRKQMGEKFAYDALQYVHTHPEVEPYFHRVIRPAMTSAINQLGLVA